MQITWNRDKTYELKAMYTGRSATQTFVINRPKSSSSWELWTTGLYMGKFKTLKAAKAYAVEADAKNGNL